MITINGINYEEREQPKQSRRSSKLLMIAAMFGGYGVSGLPSKERPLVNLEHEFELIQNKQSKLSKSNREWVVATFNRKYKQL